MTSTHELYYGGEWHEPASGAYIEVENPATRDPIGKAADGTAADIDEAVTAARTGFEKVWRDWDANDRAAKLRELADVIRSNHESLVELETLENGKPLHESDRDVKAAARKLEYYASAADTYHGETLPARADIFDFTIREPYGVVGIIVPWNWPPMHVCDFLGPTLATGNVAIIKPAPETPLSALLLAELFDEHLPAGVFNVVTGGVDPGAALTSHPDVDMLAFTGNSETGSKVLAAASEHITPAVMELGGKNAAILFEDADLDLAIPGLVDGCFFNSGEACSSAERVLVHESIHEEFMDRFVEATAGLPVGDGRDPETMVGPLVSQKELDKVERYITLAKAEGADLVHAGDLPTDPALEDGFFVAPHVFDGVTRDMRLFNEEVFGPVIAVSTFTNEAEAIELSNQVEYGLTGAVFTDDARRAMRVAKRLETGMVYINNFSRGGLAPFGGYKRSGIGRKNAFEETMAEFSQTKTVRYNVGESVETME